MLRVEGASPKGGPMNGKVNMLINRVMDKIMDAISAALDVLDRRHKFDQINSVQIFLYTRHLQLLRDRCPDLVADFEVIMKVEDLEDGEQDQLFLSIDRIPLVLAEANERAEAAKGLEMPMTALAR